MSEPLVVSAWAAPWGDGTSYRIWLYKTHFGIYQRHEWRFADGRERMDSFIASPMRQLPAQGYAAAEAFETPDLVAALERIAAGDNDARATAVAALRAFRAVA